MKKQIRLLKIYIARLLLAVLGVFYKSEKQVIFSSFVGKQYSDSPRAISEKLHEMYPDYRIVWVYNKQDNAFGLIPSYVKTVKSGTLEYYNEFAKSCCFVTNEALIPCFYKRKDQLFIQTWHGDRGFKKVLFDALEPGKKRAIPLTDYRDTDLCVAASTYGAEIYHSAFHYCGEILNIGMPRNDKLVSQSKDEAYQIKRRLGLEDNTKILLYAPTFRDNNKSNQRVNVDLAELLSQLETNGERWVCLIRAHSVADDLVFQYDGEKFINASPYPDMADLLLIADFLITDYSSSAGDFVLLNRPVILAAFDKKEYMESCRDFAVDIEEPGFIVAHDQEELMKLVAHYQQSDYEESCARVKAYYGVRETGKSSEEICKRIDQFYMGLQHQREKNEN